MRGERGKWQNSLESLIGAAGCMPLWPTQHAGSMDREHQQVAGVQPFRWDWGRTPVPRGERQDPHPLTVEQVTKARTQAKDQKLKPWDLPGSSRLRLPPNAGGGDRSLVRGIKTHMHQLRPGTAK